MKREVFIGKGLTPRPRFKESHPQRESKLEEPFRKEPIVKVVKVYKGGARFWRSKKSAALNEAKAILKSQCNCDCRGAWANELRYACRYHHMNVDDYKKLRGRIAKKLLAYWGRDVKEP